MPRFFPNLSVALRSRWLRRSINKALALGRYDVRKDVLVPAQASFRLAVSWRAREVHPWDRDLSGDRRDARLVEQTFRDTQEALQRLFTILPEVDCIDVNVLPADTSKQEPLIRGSVARTEFETWKPASIAMRFRLLGLRYNLVGSRLEPLDGVEAEPSIGAAAAADSVSASHTWHHDKAGPH
jgi:hypothetical protein